MKIVFDCETDGLKPTKVHCLVAEVLGGERKAFTEAQEFNDWLAQHKGATLYAHNGFGFDYPVLHKLWGTDWAGFTLRDTLCL